MTVATTGLTIPEAHGGAELGYVALCGLAYELGRHLTPAPFSSSVYLVAEALTLYGSDAQKQAWLPGLADGTLAGCFAVGDGGGKITSGAAPPSEAGLPSSLS